MSLLKSKSNDKATASLVPLWHPNFRVAERLPDVKVVRTSFFVNGVGLALALALLIYCGIQEYDLHELHVQIAEWDRQISATKAASDQDVRIFNQFQSQGRKAAEIKGFLTRDFVLSDFIVEIAQTLPKNITLDSISIHDEGVTLAGTVSGTSDEASGRASAYVAKLRANPKIGPKFVDISLTGISRGARDGQLNFQLSLKSPPRPKS
jgi:hypothetical protein